MLRGLSTSPKIVICGGGAFGLSSAYFLAKHALQTSQRCRIQVIEKDPSLADSSIMRSAASIRQQFSREENIHMSRFGSEFFQEEVKADFVPMPYTFLASCPQGEQVIKQNHATQLSVAPNQSASLLNPTELQEIYPEMDIHGNGILMASIGHTGIEGFIDQSLFCSSMKSKAKELGVEFIKGEVTHLDHKRDSVSVTVKQPGNNVLQEEADQVVLTTGAWSHSITKSLGIPDEDFPVRARRRVIFAIHAPDYKPGSNLHALFCLPNGVYFRPERNPGYFIAGCHPDNDPDYDPYTFDLSTVLEEDQILFNEKIWPSLYQLFPSVFDRVKLNSQSAGYYEYNTFDQNMLIGSFPHLPKVTFAVGSSGHGLQHSPAVGRAVMELLTTGQFQTIDLTKFVVGRKELTTELNII